MLQSFPQVFWILPSTLAVLPTLHLRCTLPLTVLGTRITISGEILPYPEQCEAILEDEVSEKRYMNKSAPTVTGIRDDSSYNEKESSNKTVDE